MLVYRVETEDGIGAYNVEHNHPYSTRRHPMPHNDTPLRWEEIRYVERSEFYFGFASVDKMLSWFYDDKSRQLMRDAGLKLSVYEMLKEGDDAVRVGNAQVIFKKSLAKRVEVRELP